MSSHAKRHHYVPESYLKRFSSDKALWVFDIERNELRAQTPRDTATKGYFYALEDKDGKRSYAIEEALSEVEGALASVMERIEATEQLAESEKQTVAYFAALQMLRGPDFHEDVNTIHEAALRLYTEAMFTDAEIGKQSWDKAQTRLPKSERVPFIDAQDLRVRSERSIKTHRNRSLEMMLELASDIAQHSIQFAWMIACAPRDKSFVTTDRPLTLVPPHPRLPPPYGSVGIATKGALKMLPLSMSRCLLMGDPGALFEYVDWDPRGHTCHESKPL